MKQRSTNFELLRIVSMFMIIVFHCAYHSTFNFDGALTVNTLSVKTFWMLGELGVNLFILTSGYHQVMGRFKWKKLILLIAEVVFYNVLLHLVAVMLGEYELERITSLYSWFFPILTNNFWFITTYVITYLLSPYLNKLALSLTKKEYQGLLATVLALYCVIPTFFGLIYNSTEKLLYYNSLIWMLIVYLLGAYIRLHSLPLIDTMKRSVCLGSGMFLMLVLSIIVFYVGHGFFAALGTTEIAYFWMKNNIPMLLTSVGVFGIFMHLDLSYNSVINRLSSTTLGMYMLHDSGVLRPWLWNKVVRCAEYQQSPWLIPRILFSAGVIFAVGGGYRSYSTIC